MEMVRIQHENYGHYSPSQLYRAGLIPAVPDNWICKICNQFIQKPHGKKTLTNNPHPGRLYCDLAFRYGTVYYNYVSWTTRKAYTVYANTRTEIVYNTKRALAYFHDETITELRTDAEFNTKEMQKLCAENKIQIKCTAPYMPYQHGLIERFNRTQMMLAAKMHLQSQLPEAFFCFAVMEATNIYNGITHSSTGKIPDPTWAEKPPPAQYGCICYYKTMVGREQKESHVARRGIYLGRSRDHGPTVYRIAAWSEGSQPDESRVIYSGMVKWEQNCFWKTYSMNPLSQTPQQGEMKWTSTNINLSSMGVDREPEDNELTQVNVREERTTWDLPDKTTEQIETRDSQRHEQNSVCGESSRIFKRLQAHNNPGIAWEAPPKPRPRPRFDPRTQQKIPEEVIMVAEEGTKQQEAIVLHKVYELVKETEEQPEFTTTRRIQQLKTMVLFDEQCPKPRSQPPRNYNEWQQMPQSSLKEKIKCAMELELRTLTAKGVFGGVMKHMDTGYILGKHGTRIPVVKSIGYCKRYRSKWEYVYKDSKVKARTCILGNTIHKPKALNTYAPTAKPESMRLLNSYAAINKYSMRSADVTAAFVNARRHDLMFIAPIEGMCELLGIDPMELRALLLIKSSYGTDDGPMLWNMELDMTLKALGFERSAFDPCTYSKSTIRLGIHVDDFKYTGVDWELDAFEAEIAKKYEITFDGVLSGRSFLNQKYEILANGIFVHMADYIEELCIRYQLTDRKTKYTPSPGIHIGFPEAGAKQDPKYADIPYRELTGALQHIATYLRLDIVEATNACSRFNHCYTEREWKYATHILLYLRTTKFKGHWYPYHIQAELTAITAGIRGLTEHIYDQQLTYISSDASFSHGKQQDIMGYIALYNGTPIAWKSKKVSAVHFAPNEAEYRGMAHAVSMGVWLVHQASWMGTLDPEHKIVLYNDNTGAIEAVRKPPGGQNSMPHISRYAAFAMSHASNHFVIKYRQSKELRADLMTKNLPRIQHEKLCNQLLRERYELTMQQHDLQMT